MIRVKTLQTFLVEYVVPEKEYIEFMVSFNNGKHDIDKYETDQRFLGEHIVHNTRDCQRVRAGSDNCPPSCGRGNKGPKSK